MERDLQRNRFERDVALARGCALTHVLLLLGGCSLLGVLAVIPLIASAYGLGQELLAPLGLVAKDGTYNDGSVPTIFTVVMSGLLASAWWFLTRRVSQRVGRPLLVWSVAAAVGLLPLLAFLQSKS